MQGMRLRFISMPRKTGAPVGIIQKVIFTKDGSILRAYPVPK